jgi:outer membrane protein OmpA-like peptidoglycan-associated protein
MKRQPRILAGSALGLLMASAPLGAYPLQGSDAYHVLQSQPIIRVQAAACPEGTLPENCVQGRGKQTEPAPAQKAAPAPAEQQPAPAAEQPQPRKQRQKPEKQAEPAPAEKAAPAPAEQQPAPAAEQPQPRKQQQKPQKQDEPAPKKQAEPQPEAKPAQVDQAPAEAKQPADQATESGAKKEKLRDHLKKKQGGEAAPAQAEPAQKATPEPKPAQSEPEKPPAAAEPKAGEAEQPAGQNAEPKSRKEKLRDYLKQKQGGMAAPDEAKPDEAGKPVDQAAPQAQQPAEAPKAGETAPADNQAEGREKQATQPQLPADTKPQALPKGEAEAKPLPENAAPAPDSAKKGPGKKAAGTNDQGTQPAGQQQAGEPQQPGAEQPRGAPEAVPQTDSAAQTAVEKIGKIESVEAVEGKRIDRDRWRDERRKRREERRDRDGGKVIKEVNNRVIIRFGDNIYVDNRDVNVRLERHASDSYVEELPHDFSRYTIVKEDGTRVVTIRNADGDIVRRSRITPDNREVVLYYVPENYYDRIEGGYADAGADLPPLQLEIPIDQYILDAQYAQPEDYYTYLDAPPVEQVERIYSVDEVVHSARIRDKVRRIDLDTITFDTGSAEVGEDQVNHLQALGDAINRLLKDNPAETFLIEGHTDAVGSDESNLVLSDERAQAVAEVLTGVFDIPAENLTTQGYGEQYLKVNTSGASRENRRVAVRRITPLVAHVASNE